VKVRLRVPAAKPEYVPGPDGLPARVVGEWVDRKAYYLDRYARMFAVGMRNAWPRRSYIELFAGPGVSWEKTAGRYVSGSALKAMEHPFTDFFFVDRDSTAVRALRERAPRFQAGRALLIYEADCNRAVDDITMLLSGSGINLVFADPTAAQVRFSTIEKFARVPRTDLLFTFHVGAIRRAAAVGKAESIDLFFPDGADWRAATRLPRLEQIPSLLQLYARGLEPFGYLQEPLLWVPMRSRSNSSLPPSAGHPLGRPPATD
jgi:three-Cys-motif partner protein